MAQRNAEPADDVAARAVAAPALVADDGGRVAASRAPSARTTIPSRVNVALTEPSWSVR